MAEFLIFDLRFLIGGINRKERIEHKSQNGNGTEIEQEQTKGTETGS